MPTVPSSSIAEVVGVVIVVVVVVGRDLDRTLERS